MRIVFLFAMFSLYAENLPDLEEAVQDFVLETKRIEIPGYPTAFNPSIIRWQDFLLLSFRILPNLDTPFVSQLGLVWLDEHFNPISTPQILDFRENNFEVPSRAEDGRLIKVDKELYIVYSDNLEPKLGRGGFRVFIAEICWEQDHFVLKNPVCFSRFEGESKNVREKNWVPFESMGTLLFAYSLFPHKIFFPFLLSGECETIAETQGNFHCVWGELRGGTTAQRIGDTYLAFFHSSKKTSTVHSNGKHMLHYMMGAYTFSSEHPFSITQISPEPIIGKNFYHGTPYPTYKNWSSMRGIFPCGFVMDDQNIWVAYGKQDHEVWVAKLDKNQLLQSLIPVAPLQIQDYFRD